MKNLTEQLATSLTEAVQAAFGEKVLAEVFQSEFAHYQCNTPLRLAKVLQKNPREVAQQIIDKCSSDICEKFEISGPGFINITLKLSVLSEDLSQIFRDVRLGVPEPLKRQRIIVEFSSPNVAKELHVGHLRSTIIGDSLARLFEFLGHDVLRLNHIGDWGTQFGMLIAYIQQHKLSDEADLPTLMGWYKASKLAFDADPEFKKKSQLKVIQLQAGDAECVRIWKQICAISRRAYQEIYDLLDVKLLERGESTYNEALKPLVEDLVKRGIAVDSEGAKCIFVEGEPVPFMVQKSDGGFGYATTDMAALKQRLEVEKADRVIYVIDAGQQLHMQLLFKSALKAGYYDPSKVELNHVQFGVVLGADGKKFKTRSGETERLIDLLNEAIARAGVLLQERKLNESDAVILGLDAVKYADLSNQRIKDYVFSYDRMLCFEGNTAAYLLYSYVRIQGIKRKVGKNLAALERKIVLKHPAEIKLGLHLRQFGETLDHMALDLMPHRLTDYLYTLAEKFNAFYRDCSVEGHEDETSRLLLSELTARILQQGLQILGLKTIERM
ncbi:MAG: arginine--tRNA ligase [Simkaniaceae bacterium]|nr:arginine--tRNA ligase [Simkaniaceae bacterium]